MNVWMHTTLHYIIISAHLWTQATRHQASAILIQVNSYAIHYKPNTVLMLCYGMDCELIHLLTWFSMHHSHYCTLNIVRRVTVHRITMFPQQVVHIGHWRQLMQFGDIVNPWRLSSMCYQFKKHTLDSELTRLRQRWFALNCLSLWLCLYKLKFVKSMKCIKGMQWMKFRKWSNKGLVISC